MPAEISGDDKKLTVLMKMQEQEIKIFIDKRLKIQSNIAKYMDYFGVILLTRYIWSSREKKNMNRRVMHTITFGSWNKLRRYHQEWTKQFGGLGIFGVVYNYVLRSHQIQQKLIGVTQ